MRSEIFRESGQKLDPFDNETPLYYGDFYFKVDVDTGRIINQSDVKLYIKVKMNTFNTLCYDYLDKDNNKIYQEEGYAHKFLSMSLGKDIFFDVDTDRYILGWKEKKIKEKIIEHLEFFLGKFDFN